MASPLFADAHPRPRYHREPADPQIELRIALAGGEAPWSPLDPPVGRGDVLAPSFNAEVQEQGWEERSVPEELSLHDPLGLGVPGPRDRLIEGAGPREVLEVRDVERSLQAPLLDRAPSREPGDDLGVVGELIKGAALRPEPFLHVE